MHIRNNFNERTVVHPEHYEFIDSPLAGVSRMMLERAGAEVARATSIVRYQPGSGYSAHTHGGGEEILVLEGSFYDEHGAYPAHSWLRNPKGSTHTPFTRNDSALIYVKTGHIGAHLMGDRFIHQPTETSSA